MDFDGKKQRNALTAAENALRALADSNVARATKNATSANRLDQIGAYAGLGEAVRVAVAEVEHEGEVSADSWDLLAKAVGDGPLGFLVDELRR